MSALALWLAFRRRLPRHLLAWVGVAYLARLGTAIATQFYPIFPHYYYADASMYRNWGIAIRGMWLHGGALPDHPIAPSHLLYADVVALFMTVWGPYPLVPQLVNIALSAAVVGIVLSTAIFMFPNLGVRAAALGAALALWPSTVFWGSQNFRDPIIEFFVVLALAVAVRFWHRPDWIVAVASLALAALASVTRAYIGFAYAVAVSLAAAFGRFLRWGWLLPLAAVAIAVVVQHLVHLRGMDALTPEALSQLRPVMNLDHRYVHSLIFPGVHFSTWGDVLHWFPVMFVYVAVMPLPFVYPGADGAHLGLLMQSLENVALLAAWVAAIAGLVRHVRRTDVWMLALYVAVLVAMYAFAEPDLGSVSRHRIQYLPILLLLAFLPGRTSTPVTGNGDAAPPAKDGSQ